MKLGFRGNLVLGSVSLGLVAVSILFHSPGTALIFTVVALTSFWWAFRLRGGAA